MSDHAERLLAARLDRVPIEMLSESDPALDVDAAYAIQEKGLADRLAAGERIVGGKLGFTSRAMQEAMGVASPNFGWLTDAMLVNAGRVDLDTLIHPKVEPEIAFFLATDLEPPVTLENVLAATAGVAPCLEVVDSRYVGFRFRAVDNIADNSSAGLVVLGDRVTVDVDLSALGVAAYVDGSLHATATGAAALDHPAAAVAWMANHSPRRLEAGWVVISGGLTSPVDLHPGTVVSAEFDRIGSVTLVAA